MKTTQEQRALFKAFAHEFTGASLVTIVRDLCLDFIQLEEENARLREALEKYKEQKE